MHGQASKSTYGLSLGGPIIKDKLFIFVNGEIEKSEFPGIDWSASKGDGSDADAEKKISRTTTADMQTIKQHFFENYGYNPGDLINFGSYLADESTRRLLARLDWNISNNAINLLYDITYDVKSD